MTPSHSSGSLNADGLSKAPRRLPATINKELEKRKIGSSLTNINIADSIRDKSQRRNGNGGGGRKGSGSSEISQDEVYSSAGRRKPGHLRDSLASNGEKYARSERRDSVLDL